MTKLMPSHLAKSWAKRNPERTARIDVVSLVRSRKARVVMRKFGLMDGFSQRTNVFYAHGGALKRRDEIDGELQLVVFDLCSEPSEVIEIPTSRCFYYRDFDGSMAIWRPVLGRNQRILPTMTYEVLPFLETTEFL